MDAITFDITFADGTTEQVRDANAYQQEQSMTTFFATDGARQVVDCWAVRVASFRTDAIVSIRRNCAVGSTARHRRGVDRPDVARRSIAVAS